MHPASIPPLGTKRFELTCLINLLYNMCKGSYYQDCVMSEDNDTDFVSITEEMIHDKICHVLTIYPGISYSMLQVGIGPAISPRMWHPVMQKLKERGRVQEREQIVKGPTDRVQTYKHLWLIPV